MTADNRVAGRVAPPSPTPGGGRLHRLPGVLEGQTPAVSRPLPGGTTRRVAGQGQPENCTLSDRSDTMNRVNWNGTPLETMPQRLPANLRQTIFDYLPPPLAMTPTMEEMAQKYQSGEWIKTPEHYAPMQAAYFLRPRSQDDHRRRRDTFRSRVAEAEADGFLVPDIFREFVETDAYVDRVHHNTIWLQLPEELWRLPSDPSRVVFLAFTEGQGCCNWHLLLASDGSHSMISCEHPFGLPSNWPRRAVPDYNQWKVELCADSVEEWLYYYFLDSAEHDRHYIERLRPYHPNGWSG